MRISDWSSDVCSSDLALEHPLRLCEPLDLDAVLHQIRRADQAARRLAGDQPDPADVPFGGGTDGVEPDQGAGRHHDAGTGLPRPLDPVHVPQRSEDGLVGKECFSTCRSRWSTYNSKTTPSIYTIKTLHKNS